MRQYSVFSTQHIAFRFHYSDKLLDRKLNQFYSIHAQGKKKIHFYLVELLEKIDLRTSSDRIRIGTN